jgi:hypothetical protein
MSYLIELQTPASVPSYMLADGVDREEVHARIQAQLAHLGAGEDEEERLRVLAVHTVH